MYRWDRVLLFFGIIALIVGFIGSVAPILPGPILSIIGILLIQMMDRVAWSWTWTIVFGILVIVSMLIDYYLPIRWTKRYWWTKRGAIGSTIGMAVWAFVVPPFGLILLPCVGAFLGEYYISKLHGKAAFYAARWSFIGFLLGTGYKLILCGWMLVWAIKAAL